MSDKPIANDGGDGRGSPDGAAPAGAPPVMAFTPEALNDPKMDPTKTQPKGKGQDAGDGGDTRTQLIRPPNMVEMDGVQRKLLKISCHKCLQKLDVTFLEPFSRFNCPSCDVELIVPQWFDNYLLEEPGGIGGMAIVYRALDLALDREVAIKVLNPDLAKEGERAELFLHEARTAATINHYAVIPIYTCGFFENQAYIVMQFMSGGSLELKLKLARGLLPINDVVKWIRDVAEGLDNARRHGITHHDVKPGNIMLDSDGNAKIGDFGLAQAVNDVRSERILEMTKSWASPHYVSPEKLRTGKEDFLGDIYSLGATFYNLVTGFTPFNNASVDELLKMRLTLDPPPPHQHRQEIPPQISRLILSMMDREPDRRPHYREIAKTLSEFLKANDAKLKSSKAPKIKAPAPGQQQDRLQEILKPKPKGSGKLLAINLILFLALCGGAAYAWKAGKLQPFLPAFLKGGAQELSEDADKVPEATSAFAAGDSPAALKAAEKVFSDISAPPQARIQAAVQLAIANYLVKAPKAKENCSFIAERLEAIQAALSSGQNLSWQDPPSKCIVDFLSNYDLKSADLRDGMAAAPQSYRLTASLAIFLRSAYLASKPDGASIDFRAEFNTYKASASMSPKDIWGNPWRGRLDAWSAKLAGSPNAPSAEALEPIFASLTPQAPSATGAPAAPRPHGAAVKPAKPEAPPFDPVFAAKVTAQALQEAAASAMQTRPRPDGLEFDRQAVMSHIAGLPEALRTSENARAEIVMSMKDYICRLMIRIPYECDAFETKAGQLGKGVLMANSKYLSFKSQDGKRSRLNWNELPVAQFIRIAEYYAKTREQAIADSVLDPAEKLEIAKDYLRLAVLSSWYGEFQKSADFAIKALKSDGGSSKDVERLLLK